MSMPTLPPASGHAASAHDGATVRDRTAVARWIAALEACPRPRFVLIAWGIAIAALGCVALFASSPADWPIMGSRSTGWRDSLRSGSGVAMAIAAVMVLFMQRMRWLRTLAVLAVMVLAYVSIGTFGITAIREHRDHRLGVALGANLPQSHPFWHPAYLG